MAFVLVTSLICLMLFIISLYIVLVKGYFIFMSMLYSRRVRHLYEYDHLEKCICCQTQIHMIDCCPLQNIKVWVCELFH